MAQAWRDRDFAREWAAGDGMGEFRKAAGEHFAHVMEVTGTHSTVRGLLPADPLKPSRGTSIGCAPDGEPTLPFSTSSGPFHAPTATASSRLGRWSGSPVGRV